MHATRATHSSIATSRAAAAAAAATAAATLAAGTDVEAARRGRRRAAREASTAAAVAMLGGLQSWGVAAGGGGWHAGCWGVGGADAVCAPGWRCDVKDIELQLASAEMTAPTRSNRRRCSKRRVSRVDQRRRRVPHRHEPGAAAVRARSQDQPPVCTQGGADRQPAVARWRVATNMSYPTCRSNRVRRRQARASQQGRDHAAATPDSLKASGSRTTNSEEVRICMRKRAPGTCNTVRAGRRHESATAASGLHDGRESFANVGAEREQ